MYGTPILDRITKDHQAEERRSAAEARRAAGARGGPASAGTEVVTGAARVLRRVDRWVRPGLLRRLFGANSA